MKIKELLKILNKLNPEGNNFYEQYSQKFI